MHCVIYNQKGGVGKSSIASNLAAISARRGYKTLLIDLDIQCNSSRYLLNKQFDRVGYTAGDYFGEALHPGYTAQGRDLSRYCSATEYRGLYVMPSSPDLCLLEMHLAAKHKIYKLRDAVENLCKQFNAIYIDTPPALNFFTLSALIAVNSVLVPFDCDQFARRALYQVMEHITEVQTDHNPLLKIRGIIINHFTSRALLPTQIISELIDEGLPVLQTYLSSSVKMRESHELSVPLVHMVPTHKLTREYQRLFVELQG